MSKKSVQKFLNLLQSVLAAAFGVQTEKNRRRDFSSQHPGKFILAGLIFTLLFIVILVGIVKVVLY